MVKKILLTLLIVILVGAGAGGTIYFYTQNKNQIEQNASLTAQNMQIQAELNAIGSLVTTYEVADKVYSGQPVKESDLIAVSVPASTCSTASITDINNILGNYYKVDINPGTIISMDMLMDDASEADKRYTRELTFTSLPVGTVVGDYIDVRLILPNGEEYVVVSHERIERLYDTTITIHVSEEENQIINSMFAELGQYQGFTFAYLVKYIEPGKDVDTVAFYPVQEDMKELVMLNPNIKDTTRCINDTLRAHIDQVLLIYTSSNNQKTAQSFVEELAAQHEYQLGAHQMWIEEHTDEDGNFVPEQGAPTTDATVTDPSLDQMTGEAMDSLNQSIEDLEAIQ